MTALHCSALALLLAVPHAYALDLEAGAGSCKATKQTDGTLWQSEYPHQVDMRGACWSLGFTGAFNDKRSLGWSAFYSDIGRWSTNATVKGGDEARFVQSAGQVQQLTGDGGADGFGLGLTQSNSIGPVTLRPELGLFAYRYWWNQQITHPTGEYVTYTFTSPHAATSYFALTAKWSGVYLQARYFTNIRAHGFEGIAAGPLTQYTAGISIAF